MTTSAEYCSVCNKHVGNDSLVFFGDDAVCADCKDEYVQCLREGVEPTFDGGVWRKGRFIFCEPNADLTKHCLSCNAPADMTVPMRLKVIGKTLKFELVEGPRMPVDIGFCKVCRKKLNRYGKLSTLSQISFAIGFGGPMLLGWVNSTSLSYVFMFSLAIAFLAWLIRIFLMPEPSGEFRMKPDLMRISGTCPSFRELFPDLPPSRLHEHRG